MGLPERYEVIELVAENETRSFRARDKSTGQTVMVHQLLAGPNRIILLELVLRTRMTAPPGSPPRILDLGEHDGVPFVVTQEAPQFRSLREWLQTEQKAPAASPGRRDQLDQAGAWPVSREPQPAGGLSRPAPPPPPRPARDPGEFTQLYRSVMAEVPPRPQPPAPAPPAPPLPRADIQPAAASDQPGEFTRMFATLPAGRNPAPPAPAPSASEPLPAESGGPGEFTRLFKASGIHAVPPVPDAPAPAPAVSAAAPGDEFSRMFGPPVAPPQPDAPLPAPPRSQGPGEFTRMFQPPLAPSPEPVNLPLPPLAPPSGGIETVSYSPPLAAAATPGGLPVSSTGGFAPPPIAPSPPAGPGEFTRIFGSEAPSAPSAPAGYVGPRVGGATDIFSARSTPPPPPPGAAGPGEFTRVIGGPGPIAEPPPLAAVPSEARKQQRSGGSGSSYTPLFIILGFVLVVAVLLVVYFVLRR